MVSIVNLHPYVAEGLRRVEAALNEEGRCKLTLA